MIGNMLSVLVLLFVVFGLQMQFGMIKIAVCQVMPYLLIVFFIVYNINNLNPEFKILSFRDFDISLLLKFIIKPSLHFFLITISVMVLIQGTIQVVGILYGSAMVVVFSTLRTIVNLNKQMLSIFTFSAWPEIIRLDAEKNYDKLFILIKILIRTILSLLFISIVLLHFYGENIYEFWLGKRIAFNQLYMDLFLIYMFQSVFWVSLSHLLMATNRHIILSWIMFAATLLTIALSYIFGKYFGLSGVIIAMIICELALPFWIVPYLVHKYQNIFSLRFFLNELIPIIGGIVCILMFPLSIPFVFVMLFFWWRRCLPKGYEWIKKLV
ncbi:lipopolysaccharide biosynthesis protein [Candidatus Latescibacterota bacterium]